MRRSSTTVSGPATVRLRRYGEKLLQTAATTPSQGPGDRYLSGGRHVESGGGVAPAVAARLDPVAGSRAIAAVVTRPRTSSQ